MLIGNVCDAAADGKDFFNSKNVTLAATALTGAAAIGLTASLLPTLDDSDSFEVNDNGTFNRDNEDLQELITAGEDSDAEHISSDEIERSMTARNEFLAAHGYDSVPDGYEVHHIKPLSAGGTDTPDNMILLSKADHSAITATHASFYG